MIEIVEKFNGGQKNLPRDPNTGQILNVFEASGKKFYILTGEDMFPMSRWTHAGRFVAMFMGSATLSAMHSKRVEMDKMLDDLAMQRNGVRYSDIVLANRAEMDEIRKISEAKVDISLYMASLFILGEGEDITKWSFAEAEEKIQLWIDEKYKMDDFLVLAANYVAAYIEKQNNFLEVMSGQSQTRTASASASTE